MMRKKKKIELHEKITNSSRAGLHTRSHFVPVDILLSYRAYNLCVGPRSLQIENNKIKKNEIIKFQKSNHHQTFPLAPCLFVF